jgi:hypothetical protein
MTFVAVATFSRTVGPRGEKKRPLVIGLKKEELKSTLFRDARYLKDTVLEFLSTLPKKQREDKTNIWMEMKRRNQQELTEGDTAKNLEWAMTGERGARILINRKAQRGPEGRRGSGTATTMRG